VKAQVHGPEAEKTIQKKQSLVKKGVSSVLYKKNIIITFKAEIYSYSKASL